jgi:uncharacterized phage-associated protein
MGERIDEMKLHKLLYFAQRESYIRNGRPLFKGSFVAGVYGPMILSIRGIYKRNGLKEQPKNEFVVENKEVLDYLFEHYAPMKSWSLSSISHGELSWRNARRGLNRFEDKYPEISDEDIRKDAQRVKSRRNFLRILGK